MSGNVETEYGRNIVALTDERVRNRENKPRPKPPRHFPTLPKKFFSQQGEVKMVTESYTYTLSKPF